MGEQQLAPGEITAQRTPISGGDVYGLIYRDQPLCTIRRGSDGWKFWLSSCQITFADRRLRTQQALNRPEIQVLDEQNQVVASDTYSGGSHEIVYEGQTYRTSGTFDIETITDAQGVALVQTKWANGFPELHGFAIQQPLPAMVFVVLAAIVVQYGSQRGGDNISGG